jgi:hypothetical protein
MGQNHFVVIMKSVCGPSMYLYTCVTWQVTNYELPEDDTIVSKHVGGV